MIILGITTAITTGLTLYFAYRTHKEKEHYADLKAKYESVMKYLDSVTAQLQTPTTKRAPAKKTRKRIQPKL